ncbi:hypothetical protein [Qipengyuania spongiae]|uniref:Hedgehog/Intein (Hint) domain-containing protein n=1 Tax=Qipengyuania spongiae TaxID=2909673 RepID=A0ABY5SZH3_9SPHN|nr:hypothetical protein [Qipengyuania spongiae]UVI39266.1 hypothetical protein L1F33_13705 [Qipengyuania spongiae]
MIEIAGLHSVQRQRAADRDLEPWRSPVIRAFQEIGILVRRRAVADEDQPVLRDPAPPGLGKAGDDEPRALIDAGIGDLQLGVGKGDRAVAFRRGHHLPRAYRLPDPGVIAARRDLAHARPQRAALGLPLGQGLTVFVAQRVLVERIDIDRHGQPVARSEALPLAMARIAQRVRLLLPLTSFQCGLLPRGTQRLAAHDGADMRLARADAVGGVVEQADGTVAIGHGGLFAMGGGDPEPFGQNAIDPVELRPADLPHHRETVAIGEQVAAAIRIGSPQRLGHETDRIEPVCRV